MLRSLEALPKGAWPEALAIDRVVLDLEARRKRRQTLTGERGTCFLVDLAAAPSLRDGDGFRLEDGRFVGIAAAAEPLIEVRAGSGPDLVRIAWHLGNRHLPVQFVGDALRLRADHVIEDLLARLGAVLAPVEAPFDPEGGAYGRGHTHGHD